MLILNRGTPSLKEKSRPVARPDSEELQQRLSALLAACGEAEGVGIAAPQVGRNLCLFVIDLPEAQAWP